MPQIVVEKQGPVVLVTLNRPDKLNALVDHMREDFLAALQAADRQADVRAIVITGAGRGFCAGGDVQYMKQLRDEYDLAGFSRILDAANATARALFRCRKITIAAVNGPAAGGGANLALGCDIRIGADDCSFTQSFVKIGLGPDWAGSFLLPRIVGPDRARELLLTGRTVNADEAQQLGLVHSVVARQQLVETAHETAQQLAEASPDAVAAIKGALAQPWTDIDAALEYERSAQIRCFLTQQAYDAFSAFGKR